MTWYGRRTHPRSSLGCRRWHHAAVEHVRASVYAQCAQKAKKWKKLITSSNLKISEWLITRWKRIEKALQVQYNFFTKLKFGGLGPNYHIWSYSQKTSFFKAIEGFHLFFGQSFDFQSIWKYFSLRFQRRKPRRKIIFSYGDMAETVEGTSGNFLYKRVYFRPKISENGYYFHHMTELWYKY